MSVCTKCGGSGEVETYIPADGDVPAGMQVTACECARDTIPTPTEAEQCAAMGCHGCPACIPGYIP